MITEYRYFRIYKALVARDFIVIKKRYAKVIIDSMVQLILTVFLFGSFFPLFGVPPHFIAPLFIGSQAINMFFFGMNFGLRNLFDLQHNRFIDYRLTLPLPKRWLFASYITYFICETFALYAPLFTIGILLLGPKFRIVHTSPLFFILISLITLCFYGIFFLALSFHYEYDWFMQNVWPRRLSILFVFSPLSFLWKSAYSFSPKLAVLMLLSPLTYAIEGLRGAIIGTKQFLSPLVCISMLCFFLGLAILFLAQAIKRRLDPV